MNATLARWGWSLTFQSRRPYVKQQGYAIEVVGQGKSCREVLVLPSAITETTPSIALGPIGLTGLHEEDLAESSPYPPSLTTRRDDASRSAQRSSAPLNRHEAGRSTTATADRPTRPRGSGDPGKARIRPQSPPSTPEFAAVTGATSALQDADEKRKTGRGREAPHPTGTNGQSRRRRDVRQDSKCPDRSRKIRLQWQRRR